MAPLSKINSIRLFKKPRIIYQVEPSIIFCKPSEFKDVVQRLTGINPSSQLQIPSSPKPEEDEMLISSAAPSQSDQNVNLLNENQNVQSEDNAHQDLPYINSRPSSPKHEEDEMLVPSAPSQFHQNENLQHENHNVQFEYDANQDLPYLNNNLNGNQMMPYTNEDAVWFLNGDPLYLSYYSYLHENLQHLPRSYGANHNVQHYDQYNLLLENGSEADGNALC